MEWEWEDTGGWGNPFFQPFFKCHNNYYINHRVKFKKMKPCVTLKRSFHLQKLLAFIIFPKADY